jgi:hypothetical protein
VDHQCIPSEFLSGLFFYFSLGCVRPLAHGAESCPKTELRLALPWFLVITLHLVAAYIFVNRRLSVFGIRDAFLPRQPTALGFLLFLALAN